MIYQAAATPRPARSCPTTKSGTTRTAREKRKGRQEKLAVASRCQPLCSKRRVALKDKENKKERTAKERGNKGKAKGKEKGKASGGAKGKGEAQTPPPPRPARKRPLVETQPNPETRTAAKPRQEADDFSYYSSEEEHAASHDAGKYERFVAAARAAAQDRQPSPPTSQHRAPALRPPAQSRRPLRLPPILVRTRK